MRIQVLFNLVKQNDLLFIYEVMTLVYDSTDCVDPSLTIELDMLRVHSTK
jgi:hypothetical protein